MIGYRRSRICQELEHLKELILAGKFGYITNVSCSGKNRFNLSVEMNTKYDEMVLKVGIKCPVSFPLNAVSVSIEVSCFESAASKSGKDQVKVGYFEFGMESDIYTNNAKWKLNSSFGDIIEAVYQEFDNTNFRTLEERYYNYSNALDSKRQSKDDNSSSDEKSSGENEAQTKYKNEKIKLNDSWVCVKNIFFLCLLACGFICYIF